MANDGVSAGADDGRQPAGLETPVPRSFLIADVRGYTRFTQTQGDEEAGKLAGRFAALVREAITAAGGEVLELRGDEALCVFPSARQALRGAVELQILFRRSGDGGPGFPLGVGIGLAAGEAVPVEGGYRGASLNLAARLCSLAGPGQILASEMVTGLAGALPGARFVERRRVRVKGFEKPVGMVEVVPEVELPPVPKAPKQRTFELRHAALLALLGLAIVAGGLVYALTSSEPDGLPGLAENSVGLVDTDSSRIVAEVPLGGPADAIAAGGGSVWVADALAGTVSRIDPGSLGVRTIDVGGRPSGLAFAAGSLWVANSEARAVTEIDAESARVVQTIPVGNGPRAVAVGFDAVWVANSLDGTVSRIDPDRPRRAQVISVGGGPVALAVFGEAVWVASESSGVVTRIAGESGDVVATIEVGSGPSAVAGGAGAVWVANRQDATVSRIDPATNSVTAAPGVGPRPVAVAVVGGSVWVAESGSGTLSRIDSGSAQVESTLSLTASPVGLAPLDDGLWTTASAPLDSHRGGSVQIASNALDFIDPSAAWSRESWRVMSAVYDGLVGYRRVGGAAGGTLLANLATQIPTPTDGGRTYAFQLRPGIRYSNGEPVRAEDFRASLERTFTANDPPLPLFAGVVGGRACLEQPADCDLSRGVETSDEARTVIIHLTAPDPDFLYKLAIPLASFVPADSPETLQAGEPLPGTGPYRIQSGGQGGSLRLVRNSYFRVWASDVRPDGYPEEILIQTGAEADQQVRAVLNDEADWAEVVGERIPALRRAPPAQLHSDPLLANLYMFLNVRRPPFDDLRVRQAVNYAADRARLADLLGGPLIAQPTCQMLPPNLFGYRPQCMYTVEPNPAGTWIAPDLARASRLVEASGTTGTRVTVWTFDEAEPLGRYFVSLLRTLGYRTSLRVLDQGEYFASVSDSSTGAQIGPVGWFADFPAPSNFVAQLFGCASFLPRTPFDNTNYSGLCDRRVDAEIAAAREAQVLDPQAAAELWAAADRAVMETAAGVPVANLRAVAVVSERLGNYQYHPIYGALLDQLWVR